MPGGPRWSISKVIYVVTRVRAADLPVSGDAAGLVQAGRESKGGGSVAIPDPDPDPVPHLRLTEVAAFLCQMLTPNLYHYSPK